MDNDQEPKRRGPKLRPISLAQASPIVASQPVQAKPPPKPKQAPARRGPPLRQLAIIARQTTKVEPLPEPASLGCDIVKDLIAQGVQPSSEYRHVETHEEAARQAVRNWPKYEPVPLGTKRKPGRQMVDLRRTLLLSMEQRKEGEKLA